jgi:hypothetical protein
MKKKLFLLMGTILLFASCSEQYSNGERIGVITRFSQKGLIFKSWEANLNITQTGMNTSGEPFYFSVDNNKEDINIITLLDSAANKGWKVKVAYHECYGKNITSSRGETNYFIDKLVVLDKRFTEKLQFNNTYTNYTYVLFIY